VEQNSSLPRELYNFLLEQTSSWLVSNGSPVLNLEDILSRTGSAHTHTQTHEEEVKDFLTNV